jgi:hypothetical protein
MLGREFVVLDRLVPQYASQGMSTSAADVFEGMSHLGYSVKYVAD